MLKLYGLRIILATEHPRYQLPDDVPCTPAYRRELNAWAEKFFGTWSGLHDGEVLYPGDGTIIMNSTTLAELKKQLQKYAQFA